MGSVVRSTHACHRLFRSDGRKMIGKDKKMIQIVLNINGQNAAR
jgi:hypothetical protein